MASIPGLDSFGFECDLFSHTIGQVMALSYFDRWEIASGEPLVTDKPKKVINDEKTELTKYTADK